MSKESKMLNKTLDVTIEKMLDDYILDWNNPTNLTSNKRDFNYDKLIPAIKALLKEVLATVRPEELHTIEEVRELNKNAPRPLGEWANMRAEGYLEALADYDAKVKELGL